MTLQFPVRLGITLASVLLLIAMGCGSSGPESTSTPQSTPEGAVNVPVSELTETNGHIWLQAPVGTYQKGWATLSMDNGNLVVEVEVTPPEPVAQPAHIHSGNCDELGGVVYPLENIVGGHSKTEINGVTITDVATGDFAINLHLSFSDFATFTACGEIPVLPPANPSAPGDSPPA